MQWSSDFSITLNKFAIIICKPCKAADVSNSFLDVANYE